MVGSVWSEGSNEEQLERIAAQEQKIFPYETLLAATKNFHVHHKLGEGGFGPVYKVWTSNFIICLCLVDWKSWVEKIEPGKFFLVLAMSEKAFNRFKFFVSENEFIEGFKDFANLKNEQYHSIESR